MTIIIEDSSQLEFHSDLRRILKSILPEISKLNWLCNNIGVYLTDSLMDQELPSVIKLQNINFNCFKSCTLSGSEFENLLTKEGVQYIWGVFSGFSGQVPEVGVKDFPFADGNGKLWTHPDKFQVANSQIEIVCFDSSCTIMKFKNDKLAQRILSEFPEGEILKSSLL